MALDGLLRPYNAVEQPSESDCVRPRDLTQVCQNTATGFDAGEIDPNRGEAQQRPRNRSRLWRFFALVKPLQ